jgi:hypothetical protein
VAHITVPAGAPGIIGPMAAYPETEKHLNGLAEALLRLAEHIQEAELRFGPIGVAGVYGVGDVIARPVPTKPLAAERIGCVIDRGRILRDGPELPARVATLDELLLGFPGTPY